MVSSFPPFLIQKFSKSSQTLHSKRHFQGKCDVPNAHYDFMTTNIVNLSGFFVVIEK